MALTTESSSKGSGAKDKTTPVESVANSASTSTTTSATTATSTLMTTASFVADKSGKILAVPVANKAPRVMNFLKPNQDFVNIIVDKEDVKQTFRVHKDLICQYSPFFKGAFDDPFEEGQTQTMRMEDVDTDLFGILVHWLYKEEIPSDRSFVTSRIIVNEGPAAKVRYGFRHDSNTANSPMALQEANKWKDLVLLAMIWTLADRCLMPRLQNDSMKLLRAEIGKAIYAKSRDVSWLAIYCYETAKQTPLKRLVVQRLADASKTPQFNNWIDQGPKAIVLDVTRHLAMRIPLAALGLSKVEDFYVEEPKEK